MPKNSQENKAEEKNQKEEKHQRGRELAARFSQLVKRYYIFVTKSLAFSAGFAAIDIVTKWWFVSNLPDYPGYIMEVTWFLNFVFVWNYGISFGLFSEYSDTAGDLFIIFAGILCVFLFYKQMQSITYRMFLSYSMIIGGACGNIYDRYYYGAVFDFIDFHYKNWHYPAFNFADSFILIGLIILVIELRNYEKQIQKLREEIIQKRRQQRMNSE